MNAKPKNKIYEAYLFVYFTGEYHELGEQIYFATSLDGLHYEELNHGKPVLLSNVGRKGLRDPYIIRSHEEDKFYLVATDEKIYGDGDWGRAQTRASQSIVIFEST